MKRHIGIFAFILLAASCTNTIELDVDMPEKRLILNALLRSGDDIHIVDMSERTDNANSPAYNGIEQVHGAQITCYINGEAVAVAEEFYVMDGTPVKAAAISTRDVSIPDKGGYGSTRYRFAASFKSGDKVRIEAKRGDDFVYSEATVPEPANLELVKMTSEEIRLGEYDVREILKVDFKVKDPSAEKTYFRLGTPSRRMELLYHYYDEEDNSTKDDWEYELYDTPPIDIENDPILNDGYMPDNDDNIFSSLNPTNECGIFSDVLFKNMEGTIGLSLENKKNTWLLYLKEETAEGKANDVNTRTTITVDVKPTMIINIETLSFDNYNYYRAMNAGEAYGFDISFLMEPIIFPTNVVGGLGFVGIAANSRLEVPAPEFTLEGSEILYASGE